MYEIETPQGWKPLKDLVKKQKKCYLIKCGNGYELGASEDHLVMATPPPPMGSNTLPTWVAIGDVPVGWFVKAKNDDGVTIHTPIISKEFIGEHGTFDFEVDSEEHAYYSNGIISHNTGKTTLGKIICNLAGDKTVIWITPDLIAENSAGKHSVKLLYTLADFVSPTALILEDIDLWAYDRNEMGDTLRLGALMNILDGVNSVKNTVTIGMTNRIELIEKALRNRPGRFDVIVEVPSLTPELRTKMLVDRTKIFKVDDGVIDHVVSESDKWTGAYVQHFIHSVNMYFVQNGSKKHLTMEIAKRVLKAIKRFTFKEHKDGSYFHNSRED